jgi:hypothetical protein
MTLGRGNVLLVGSLPFGTAEEAMRASVAGLGPRAAPAPGQGDRRGRVRAGRREDLSVCVRMSNEAVRRSSRRVDYVHMPVVREPGDAFFAPLRELDVGATSVFLGLVHHTDGLEGFRKRAALARRHLDSFGISSVCGYGRVDPAELPRILAVHRECAAELAGGGSR